MAVTADVVEVRFDADVANYLTELSRADKSVAAITERMTANAIKAGTAFSTIGRQGGGPGIVGTFDTAIDKSGQLNANVSNLAAQFQDIGVTAQMGMSPLVIALQQGTQLSAVLNQSLAGGVSPVKALGAAFAQMVNPVSLATIAVVGLAAAAIQYFTTLLTDGKASEEELKKQDDVLRDIADRWGDLVPAVRDYIAARDEAAEQKQASEGFEAVIKRGWDDAREAAIQASSAFVDAAGLLQAAGADATPEAIALYQAWNDLEAAVRAGNATTDQANALQAALANVVQTSGIPAIGGLSGAFVGLANSIAAAIAQQNAFIAAQETISDPGLGSRLTADFIADQERINGLTREQLSLENEVNRIKAEASRDDIVLTEEQALNLAKQRLAAEERRREITAAGKADIKADTAAQKEIDAVKDLIEQLEFELSLIGMTNEQKAVALAIRQAGAAATEQERIEIERLIIAQRAANAEFKRAEELYDNIKAASESALKGFLNDIRQGKSAGEAFTNVLDDILSRLIDFGVSTALNAIFPGLGTLTGSLSGARASGGPVRAGGTYMVGENGPERFTPTQAGIITRNGGDPPMMGGGRMTIYLGPGLEANLLDKAAEQSVQIVRSTVPPMISRGAPTAVAQSNRNRVA